MVALGAPLVKPGGTLVLWAPPEQNADIEADARAVAGGFGLVPGRTLAGSNVCLQTYEKGPSPAGAPAVGAELLQRYDRSFREERLKIAFTPSRREARIAKLSALIADLEHTRADASETQRAQLDSDIQRLEARRAALRDRAEEA
jgi:hypothetical protein